MSTLSLKIDLAIEDVSNAYAKIEEKGGTYTGDKTTANLTDAIDSIKASSKIDTHEESIIVTSSSDTVDLIASEYDLDGFSEAILDITVKADESCSQEIIENGTYTLTSAKSEFLKNPQVIVNVPAPEAGTYTDPIDVNKLITAIDISPKEYESEWKYFTRLDFEIDVLADENEKFTFTENGEYTLKPTSDTSFLVNPIVTVDVPSASLGALEKSVSVSTGAGKTFNYDPTTEKYDGYNSVKFTVSVYSEKQSKFTYTENGAYTLEPYDGGTTFLTEPMVIVNVPTYSYKDITAKGILLPGKDITEFESIMTGGQISNFEDYNMFNMFFQYLTILAEDYSSGAPSIMDPVTGELVYKLLLNNFTNVGDIYNQILTPISDYISNMVNEANLSNVCSSFNIENFNSIQFTFDDGNVYTLGQTYNSVQSIKYLLNDNNIQILLNHFAEIFTLALQIPCNFSPMSETGYVIYING